MQVQRLNVMKLIATSAAAMILIFLAKGFVDSARADILTDVRNFEGDFNQSNELAMFGTKVCGAKGLNEPDTMKCITDAYRDVYRKFPNPLVGNDLLVEHAERLREIAILVAEGRLTDAQASDQMAASKKIYDDAFARRQNIAKDYLASLSEQKRVSDEAVALAQKQAEEDNFNQAIGQLGLQLMKPQGAYSEPQVSQKRPDGCHLVNEVEEGFNKICMYECLKGPYAVNVSITDICHSMP